MCFIIIVIFLRGERERERERVRFQGMIMVSHLLLEIFAPAGHFDRYRVEPLDLASKSLSVASGTLYLHRITIVFLGLSNFSRFIMHDFYICIIKKLKWLQKESCH